MYERQPSIVIFEGAQGSGKTSATTHLSENGYQKVRGIPIGPELIQNREAINWKQSSLILAEIGLNGSKHALDRSLISLMAFDMRKKPENADLIYKLGSSILSRTIRKKDYCVVVINARPEDCLARENKDSVVAIGSLEQAQKEIETYSSLVKRLNADGFRTVNIDNIGITEEEFLDLVVDTLNSQK